MNDPRLPEPWQSLRIPPPPPSLRARIIAPPHPVAARRGAPIWPLLWAASMAGLVALNLWLDARHPGRMPRDVEPPPSLAQLHPAPPFDLL